MEKIRRSEKKSSVPDEESVSQTRTSQELNTEFPSIIEQLKKFMKIYQICIVSAVVIAVYQFLFSSEKYVINNIAYLSSTVEGFDLNNDTVNEGCKGVPRHVPSEHNPQQPVFHWTKGQQVAMKKSDEVAVLISFLVSGVCSDKFGGHLVHMVGLVFSGAIMLSRYLSGFGNPNLFILMFILRRFNSGVALVASMSLLGRTTRRCDRAWAAGSVVVGLTLGHYLGSCLPQFIGPWESVCVTSGTVSLLTALSYWYLSRSYFPVILQTKTIPWRDIFTSISLWVVVILSVAVRNIRFLRYSRLMRFYLYHMLHWYESPKYNFIYRFPYVFVEVWAFVIFGTGTMLMSKYGYYASGVRKLFLGLYLLCMLCGFILITVGNCILVVVMGGFLSLHFSSVTVTAVKYYIVFDVSPSFAGTFSSLAYLFVWPYFYGYAEFLNHYFLRKESGADFERWRLYYSGVFILSVISVLPSLLLDLKKVTTKATMITSVNPAAEDNVEH